MKSEEMYIFVDSGNGMMAVSVCGELTNKRCEARKFTNKSDAVLYIEKHGLEKIATVRRIEINCAKNRTSYLK